MPLTWFVVYKDQTVHKYQSIHSENNFDVSHIDLDQLDKFVITVDNNDIPFLITHFDDPRKKLIYARRIEMPNGLHPFKVICHITGWQMSVNGENVQSINYVFETVGRIEIMRFEDKAGKPGEKHIPRELYWIESAGKFDRERLSWSAPLSPEQLKIVGSKVKRG